MVNAGLGRTMTDRPTHDPTRVQIEDDGVGQPACTGPDLADVTVPFRVQTIITDILIQQVGRAVERMIAVCLASGELIHWIN